MRIEVEPNLMLRLMTYACATRGQEFSGLGFCELRKDVVWVYDFAILDIGSEVFTEIPASELLKLMQRPDARNMKVWLHRHPVGNGIPGPHNWSSTDNQTIEIAPLGGIPEMVCWSVSLVLTPGGWVGRIDNHVTRKTEHLEVAPDLRPALDELYALADKKREEARRKKDAEEAERRETLEAAMETITARVNLLDQKVLDDLGISREDLALMALEQAGIYEYSEEIDQLLDEVALEEGLEEDDARLFGTGSEHTYTFPSRDVQEVQRRLNDGSYPSRGSFRRQ